MEDNDNIDLEKFANLYIKDLRRSENQVGDKRWAIELKLN